MAANHLYTNMKDVMEPLEALVALKDKACKMPPPVLLKQEPEWFDDVGIACAKLMSALAWVHEEDEDE